MNEAEPNHGANDDRSHNESRWENTTPINTNMDVTDLLSNPDRLTELLGDTLDEITLDASVTASEVDDLSRKSITLRRHLNIEEAELTGALDDEYVAAYTVFTRGADTETLVDTDGCIVFADRRTCGDCEVVFDLDEYSGEMEDCPNCNGEVKAPALPQTMDFVQTYEFDEQVNTLTGLERELESLFDVDITLA